MRTIKVMHVASFLGNIGDNANHKGLRRMLDLYTSYRYLFNEVEIRDFYITRRKRNFDESFVNEANQHDLLLFGGGNFFDLWIDESSTGTTIDMSKEIFEQIRVPVVFFALGCDPYKGAPLENILKFRRFLDTLLDSQKCLVTVRNDGSIKNLKTFVGEQYSKKILKVPDGGFFTETCHFLHPELDLTKKNIIINLAGDMIPTRFQAARGASYIQYVEFVKEIAITINRVMDDRSDIHIVFIPHIYADIKIISETMELLLDKHRRERVTVAPYLQGYVAQNYIFDLYQKADLVIGMRFHANVCSIGFNTPTIGLGTCHYKIRDLYEELALTERLIDGGQKNFSDKLISLIESTLEDTETINNKYRAICQDLERELIAFCNLFNKMI